MKHSRIATVLACFLAWASPSAAQPSTGVSASPVLDVGFVYVSPVGQSGWTFQHDQGRLEMERAMAGRVRTRFVEAVPEGPDSERVMRDMAAQGVQLIFATSFGYLEPALKVGAQFANLRIEQAGGFKTSANVGVYNARFYEARWLAGYLAGKSSVSGVMGYVAGFPVPEVIQGINAFTQGVRAANPKGVVRVLWLNTWFDPPREREAALTLIHAGADVLTNHSGSPAVPQTAQEKGVRVIGYQSDMRRFAPDAQLAAIVSSWGDHYVRVANRVLDGSWKAGSTWGGMRDGFVKLTAMDERLDAALRRDIEQRSVALQEGRQGPFHGRLVDQSGRVRQSRGTMNDASLATMNWFVEGVVGTLPGANAANPK
jgi:basic membrane protein A and related proteins